jgi:PiT family inorganic phosphate transporter
MCATVVALFGPDDPLVLMMGMVASLLAAGIWLQIATSFGLPVSTTHSIIGALVGFALLVAGTAAVSWGMIAKVAASWVLSPVLGGLVAAAMFIAVSKGILQRDDPVGATRDLGPHLVALVVFLLVVSFVYKALGNVLQDPPWWAVILAAMTAAGVGWVIVRALLARRRDLPGDREGFEWVESVFGRLQIATACYVAFAHGANDVANAVGPVAAVVQIHELGTLPAQVPVPMWILMLGGAGIILGLATLGYKVIATVGSSITELTPTRGFSAEFGAATTVLVASRLGLPVSTTHTLVGAVVGVGMARGIAALNVRVILRIVNSWIVTLPAAAVFAALIYLALEAIFL